MDAQELIDELKSQNITLHWDGTDIIWKAPFEYVPEDEIVKLINENWDEVIKRIEGLSTRWRHQGTSVIQLTQGDCLGAMGQMPRDYVDLIVTDPPYGIDFMGKKWDIDVPPVSIWKECLRVLKPGAFAFIMSSPRQDCLARMIVNLEQAGFKTGFTSLYWTYATGFPKAKSISKPIDKKAGVEPKAIARNPNSRENCDKSSTIYESGTVGKTSHITVPVTKEAQEFEGAYGGFLPKPAVEVILVVQKPPTEKTQVEQALKNGKGVMWFDDGKIPYGSGGRPSAGDRTCNFAEQETVSGGKYGLGWEAHEKGRFSSNLLASDKILDGAKTHKGGFSKFFSLDAWANENFPECLYIEALNELDRLVFPFLIVPKASRKEKESGCENLSPQQVDKTRKDPDAVGCNNPINRGGKDKKNYHPTVKPILLVSYLITIGSREGDIVLDPFCGSGTTSLASRLLKRASIGIEKDENYFEIAAARVKFLNESSYIQNSHVGNDKDEADSDSNEVKTIEAPSVDEAFNILEETTSLKTVSHFQIKIVSDKNETDNDSKQVEEKKATPTQESIKAWDKTKIVNDSGIETDAIAPVILSASRRTDIPAWHSGWFFHRLKKGHFLSNHRGKEYVSFENVRVIVFWTKNPKPMLKLKHLDKLDDMGINYYFSYTLNDYVEEGLEPNLPPLQDRIDTFREVSEKIGKERVVWRFDPMVLLKDKIDKDRLVEKVGTVMGKLAGHTEKLVFSFLDPAEYKKVERNLANSEIKAIRFSEDDKTYVAEEIAKMAKEHNIKPATCADGKDFQDLGIVANKCVDDDLMSQVFSHDDKLMSFLGRPGMGKRQKLRLFCGCIKSFDIGTYNTCRYLCPYCYADESKKAVENNFKRLSRTGEMLLVPKDENEQQG